MAFELTQINVISAQLLETRITSLLAILRRTIDSIRIVMCANAKLRCQKDFIALSSTLEPFAQELFTVCVDTVMNLVSFISMFGSEKDKSYSAVSQKVEPSSMARSRTANLSLSLGGSP